MTMEQMYVYVNHPQGFVWERELRRLAATALIHARIAVARRGRDWRLVPGLS